MFSSSLNEFTNLENAYPKLNFEFSRTMYPVHKNIQTPEIPTIMSAGQPVFANWQPEAANNSDLLTKANITTNWQYRKYLTQNAKDLMEYNYRESNNENSLAVRQSEVPKIGCNKVQGMTNTPRLQTNVVDTTHRFGKPTSDLKNMYLSQQQATALKISPVVEQDTLNKMAMKRV